jgi:dTDP-4-dehydrorhamnose reductase
MGRSMKRIMLLGADGQVGQALRAAQLPGDWELGAFGHAECDILDHRAVQTSVQEFGPDLIVNAAAMTNVDQCEKDEKKAMEVNFEAPANLAAQCASADVPLIHLSTDFVFDGGDGETPYRTDSPMNPVNVYGYSKMMGEEAVRHELAWHAILRISSVFSAFGTNLLTKALQAIDTRDELKVVTDQKSCPTPAPDVAYAIIKIANSVLTGRSDGFGTFHFCGEGPATRLEFTQAIMDAYAPYTACRPKILPAVSADFPDFAKRPPYSVLDCARIRQVYDIGQRPWREGLAEAMTVLMRERSKVA